MPPGGANARAKTRLDFDLANLPGQKGAVFDFETSEDFDATIKMYENLAALAGVHRYGNPKARIFVQLNMNASADDGRKVRTVVDGL